MPDTPERVWQDVVRDVAEWRVKHPDLPWVPQVAHIDAIRAAHIDTLTEPVPYLTIRRRIMALPTMEVGGAEVVARSHVLAILNEEPHDA